MELDHPLRISHGFLADHVDRLYDDVMIEGVRHYVHVEQEESMFRIVRKTKAHAFLAMTAGALHELNADADFYACEPEFDAGLRSAARAVGRAIEQQYC